MNIKHYYILSALAIGLASCSTQEDELQIVAPAEEQMPEPIEISFGGVGSETRALEGSYLYAINVWLDKGKDGTYASSDLYAKGVFSSLTGVRLTTYPGYPLKFECTIVKDAQDKIASSLTNGQLVYQLPFSSACTNKFEYSTASTTISLGKQLTDGVNLASGVSTLEEVYYGILDGFTPTVDGEKAVIPVKRMNYGYRVIVEGIEDGVASLKISNATYNSNIVDSYTTPDQIRYISGSTATTAWNASDLWTGSLSATVNYTSDREAITGSTYWNKSVTKTFDVKRTKFTTVRIKLSGYDHSSANFEIELEELDFGEAVKDILMQVDKNDVGTVSN